MIASNEIDFAYVKLELDSLAEKYEHPSFFIGRDPITIPHMFHNKKDIELVAFLTSIISWGLREAIIAKAQILISLLGSHPYDFVVNASDTDFQALEAKLINHSSAKGYFYRTLKTPCLISIIKALQIAYRERGDIETFFEKERYDESLIERMTRFYSFIRSQVPQEAHSSLSSMENSAGKRANMFLRWMVRSSARGVDFGLWKSVDSAELYLPLDVHSSNTARSFGLTTRKTNDTRTVLEITSILSKLCPADPAKYDFALFGKGIEEKN